jgi:hypothetical protein
MSQLYGPSPLTLAAAGGHVECVRLLVEGGVDKTQNDVRVAPIHCIVAIDKFIA